MRGLSWIYQFLVVTIGVSNTDKILHHPTKGPILLESSDPEVPALGVKCNTAELKIVNQVVEMCMYVDVLDEPCTICQLMEKIETCLEMRSTCLDHKTLREFKDSVMELYLMHEDAHAASDSFYGFKSCRLVQEYMTSQRPTQLTSSKLCQPPEVFEVDWNYRYCVADVIRKAILSKRKTSDAFMFNNEDDLTGDEETVLDLTEYKDQLVNFCDFSQILLDCGRSFYLCYQQNLEEVEILKFLNTMYWMSEYEQPLLQFSQVAGDIGLKEVLYIAEYIHGENCDLTEAKHFELIFDDTIDAMEELMYYNKNVEL